MLIQKYAYFLHVGTNYTERKWLHNKSYSNCKLNFKLKTDKKNHVKQEMSVTIKPGNDRQTFKIISAL